MIDCVYRSCFYARALTYILSMESTIDDVENAPALAMHSRADAMAFDCDPSSSKSFAATSGGAAGAATTANDAGPEMINVSAAACSNMDPDAGIKFTEGSFSATRARAREYRAKVAAEESGTKQIKAAEDTTSAPAAAAAAPAPVVPVPTQPQPQVQTQTQISEAGTIPISEKVLTNIIQEAETSKATISELQKMLEAERAKNATAENQLAAMYDNMLKANIDAVPNVKDIQASAAVAAPVPTPAPVPAAAVAVPEEPLVLSGVYSTFASRVSASLGGEQNVPKSLLRDIAAIPESSIALMSVPFIQMQAAVAAQASVAAAAAAVPAPAQAPVPRAAPVLKKRERDSSEDVDALTHAKQLLKASKDSFATAPLRAVPETKTHAQAPIAGGDVAVFASAAEKRRFEQAQRLARLGSMPLVFPN